MKKNSYLQFNSLSKFSNIVHGIFPKIYGNFSLEYDNLEQVDKNKKIIAEVLKIEWQNIHTVYQVHGTDIQIIKSLKFNYPEKHGDGLITSKPNIFLIVKTADCFPVLMYDRQKQVVALIHVGWRGAIQKIFIETLLEMINIFQSNPKNVLIGIGPGIGPCCFKHKNLVQSKLPEWHSYIKELKNGLKSLDMTKFIIDKYIEAGIRHTNIEKTNICTNCDKRFYSHFRSLRTGETEGRFASVIGMTSN